MSLENRQLVILDFPAFWEGKQSEWNTTAQHEPTMFIKYDETVKAIIIEPKNEEDDNRTNTGR